MVKPFKSNQCYAIQKNAIEENLLTNQYINLELEAGENVLTIPDLEGKDKRILNTNISNSALTKYILNNRHSFGGAFEVHSRRSSLRGVY